MQFKHSLVVKIAIYKNTYAENPCFLINNTDNWSLVSFPLVLVTEIREKSYAKITQTLKFDSREMSKSVIREKKHCEYQ